MKNRNADRIAVFIVIRAKKIMRGISRKNYVPIRKNLLGDNSK
jgi:hypothetical protein